MQEFVIDEIEKYLDEDKKSLPYATKENIGCTVDYAAGRNRYLGYLMSLALSFHKKYLLHQMPYTNQSLT